MAKKQKDNLTIEEKLEAALVPEDEQPYEVPENWCWVRIGAITSVVGGGTPSTAHKEYYENGDIPWLSPADLSNYNDKYITNGAKNITKLGLEKSSARLMPANSVCLSSRAPIGYVVIAQNELCTNQGFKSFLPSRAYLPDYLYWYLKGIKDRLEEKASGTTFLELSGAKASQLEFPLPPLSEQHRIVSRIESLFSQLDEARDKAQEALEDYEARNASLFRAAFSGDLTKRWRNEKGIEFGWKKVFFDEVADIQCNLVDPSDYQNYPHIAPDNIEKRTGVLLNYNTIAEDKVKSGKHRFYPGQILYSKIRPYLSKVVTVDFDGLCSADMYPIKAKGDTKFLFYQMLSDDFLEQASSAGSRSVLPKINQKELSKIRVVITSYAEQKEVVRILDSILPQYQAARESIESVLDSIDRMKKAILSKAFRGELGTNDPEDESAIELLKSVLDDAQNELVPQTYKNFG